MLFTLRPHLCLFLLPTLLVLTGCGGESEPLSKQKTKYEAAEAPAPESAGGDAGSAPVQPVGTREMVAAPPPSDPAAGPAFGAVQPQVSSEDIVVPETDDVAQLKGVIQRADKRIGDIFSGRSGLQDQEKIRGELLRLGRVKQAAAERILTSPTATEDQKQQGKSEKLLALSFQAGMQDARAADQLERYAEELAGSSDPGLALQSRIVKLGFLMDKMLATGTGDPAEVEQVIERLADRGASIDMPTAMAMQQAMQGLAQVGHEDAARRVRQTIITALSNHPNAELSRISQVLTDQQRFDSIGSLVRRELEQGGVELTELRSTAQQLAEENPDAQAFSVLNASAVRLEAHGKMEAADALFEVIEQNFVQSDEQQVSQEARLAVEARKTRQEIEGTPIELHAPDLSGVALPWESYRGKVVVMPFWAAASIPSMTALGAVEDVMHKYPQQVQVIGVNVDPVDEDLDALLREVALPFPSVRNTDPQGRWLQDPLATKVGVRSFPFVLVVDRNGVARHIVLNASQLEGIVDALVSQPPEQSAG